MKEQRRPIQIKPVEIVSREPGPDERLPFLLKRFGYCRDRRFSLDNAAGLDDILILLSLTSVVEFSHRRNIVYLSPYDLVLSSCQAPLHFNAIGAEKWDFFYVVFGGAFAKYFYNRIRPANKVMRINPLSRIPDLFCELAAAAADSSPVSFVRQSALLHELVYELFKASSDVLECKQIIPAQDTDVNSAVNYIMAHYREPLTVDEICNKVCLSKYYFCKIFRRRTGVPIHQYINEYRINKSKELLSYSKLSIGDVGAAVGFKNPLTFIRSFEKYARMTPGEYRKNF